MTKDKVLRMIVHHIVDYIVVFIDKQIHFGYTLVVMNTTTIHIKTDVQTREAVKKVAEEFGFTLTSLVNALLKQIARRKRLTLDLDETPNQYMIESLKKSEEDIKAGRVSPSFTNAKDAISWLDDPNASYANGDKVRDEV
ncbi:MAG: type II toxin-antitoxin system RelB/DinJ family antitoxin [Burkholderiales bacterium]